MAFKKCSLCKKEWSTREEFLTDKDVRLDGYKWNREQVMAGLPSSGILVFTHRHPSAARQSPFPRKHSNAASKRGLMNSGRNSTPISSPESSGERIRFLEKENLRRVKAVDFLASMQEVYALSISPGKNAEVLTSVSEHVGRLDVFRATAFVMGDGDDLDFRIELSTPAKRVQFFESEIECRKADGQWDYALQVNRPVIAPGTSPGDMLILHAVATRQRIFGMFVGVLHNSQASPSDESLNLLSIVLSITANSLENSYTHRKLGELLQARTEELNKARCESQSALVAKKQFLANMSHEIRTPMNGILGPAELLRDSGLNSIQSDYVETIQSSGEALLAIITDILDFSRIEARELQLQVSDFSVREIIDDTLTLIMHKAQEKKIEIIKNVDEGIPETLEGDPKRLRQILAHLAGNAVKFTNEGTITVRCNVERQTQTHVTLHFEVADTGIGISETDQFKLFESFTQADGSSTRKYGGSGLGIATCKGLAELMGGSMTVTSVPGKGSTFSFTAVLAIHSGEPVMGSSAIGTKTLNHALPDNLKILLVEDNAVNQKVALRMLEKLGNVPTIAQNGREAIDAATCERFDIILMDCMMPELDGFEATKQIRALQIDQPIIIAMTAGILQSEKDLCFEVGMDDYLAKPVKFDTLSSKICKWTIDEHKSLPQKTIVSVKDKESNKEAEMVRDEFILLLDQSRRDELRELSDGNDSLLRELIEIFFQDGPGRVASLRNSLQGMEAFTISQIAHTLKGSAHNIGAVQLAQLCQTLEHSAKNGELTGAGELVSRIEKEFTTAKNMFEQSTKTG